jgi:hypothetical protein
MENNNIEVSNNYNNFQREQIMNSMKINSKNRKISHSANSRDTSLLFNNKIASLNNQTNNSSKMRAQDPTAQDFINN